jgi:hypothetical protein
MLKTARLMLYKEGPSHVSTPATTREEKGRGLQALDIGQQESRVGERNKSDRLPPTGV